MEIQHDSLNHAEKLRGLNINIGNVETKSNIHKGTMDPLKLLDTRRSMRMEMRSYKAYNDKMLMFQERQNQMND